VRFLPGSAEARLLALLGEADALGTRLSLSSGEAARLLAVRAAEVGERLGGLRVALTSAGVLVPGGEAEQSIDALLRLSERPAPVRDSRRIDAHARRIAAAAADLRGDVVTTVARARRRLDRPVLTALRRLERAHDELQVRLRAAAAVARLTAGLRGQVRDVRRREVAGEVAALARRLEERRERLWAQREMSAVLWRELDAELHASVEEVGTDLGRLLG
jgi:hypothetical protein